MTSGGGLDGVRPAVVSRLDGWTSRMLIKYAMIIHWSNEDNAFIVEVPELPGCMADGTTYQEAVTNAEIIIQEWIETARNLGRPVPEPKRRLIYA